MYQSIVPTREFYFIGLFISLCFLAEAQTSRPVPSAYNSNDPINYVRTFQSKKPITDPASLVQVNNVDEVQQETNYFDGLGRPLQTVLKQYSPQKKDMVTALEYDSYGREQFKYLPFVSTAASSGGGITNDGLFKRNAFHQQKTFYDTYLAGQGQTFYYGHDSLESSPLSRVISSYAPGNSWVGTESQSEANRHGIDIRYGINTTVDAVRVWTVTDNGIGSYASYASPGTYAAGQLSKLITEDEHGGEVVEFKDKDGNVVMKKVLLTANRDMGAGQNHTGWLVTYYMYDDVNRLRCVLQPKGFELAAAAGMTLTNAQILSQQCFRYEYDVRNRMIMKQVPGAGTVEMVYDARDRLVMSRDSSLKSQGYWQWNNYDNLNRLVQNGLTGNSSSRATHQAQANSSINYPATDVPGLLQVNYYGDYAWTSGVPGMSNTVTTTDVVSNFFFTSFNTAPDYAQPMTPDYVNIKNKQTGYWVRMLGTSTLLYTAIFYDQESRVIQTRETNVSGGVDITSFQYDFSGKLLRKLLVHQKGGTTTRSVKELTKFTYDHAGRQTAVVKKIGLNGTDKPIVNNTYDELGRLKTKNIGTGLESQTYDYNIRGWLLGANRGSLTAGGPAYFQICLRIGLRQHDHKSERFGQLRNAILSW